MARRRQFTQRYPHIPLNFLIATHNAWIDRANEAHRRGEAVFPAAWRKVDRRQDVDVYHDLRWVLEQRIIHFDMVMEMARKKQVYAPKAQVTGLADPWGSAPRFPNKYELRFKYRDGKFSLHLFAAEYSAWHFLQAVIKGRKPQWIAPNRVIVGDDIEISGKRLDLLIDYTPSAAERAWVLPLPYSYYAHTIATGEPWRGEPGVRHDAASNSEERKTDRSSRSERANKRRDVQNGASSTKRSRSKSVDGTTFGIPELADTTGKDASRIRSALRKSDIDKPDAGWVWPVAEKEQVLKAIKKFLK